MKRTEFHRILTKVLAAGVETLTLSRPREDPRYPGEWVKGPTGATKRFQTTVLRLRSSLDGKLLAERDLEADTFSRRELLGLQVDFVLDYIERNDIQINQPDPVDPVSMELSQTKEQVATLSAQVAELTRMLKPGPGAESVKR